MKSIMRNKATLFCLFMALLLACNSEKVTPPPNWEIGPPLSAQQRLDQNSEAETANENDIRKDKPLNGNARTSIWVGELNNKLCGGLIWIAIGDGSYTAEIANLGLFAYNNTTGASLNVELGVVCAQVKNLSAYYADLDFKYAFNQAINTIYTRLQAGYYGANPLSYVIQSDLFNLTRSGLPFGSSLSWGYCAGSGIPLSHAEYC